jgi:glycosyltransferase involved in cell wall biosynthesis
MLPIAVLLKIICKKPIIYDAHEIYIFMEAEKFNVVVLKVIELVECFCIKYFVDEFITVSEQRANEYWLQKIPALNYTVVGNWHNIVSEASEEDKLSVREKLDIKHDAKVIGYIGSISPSRNIASFCEFLQKNKNFIGIIAGRGSEKEEKRLRDFSLQNDNIKFIGYVSDPYKIYNACDALIYLIKEDHNYSNWIAPNNLYIAMACSKPLISLNKGEVKHIFKRAQIGYCVEDYSYSELLKATDYIFDKKIFKLIKGNIQSIQEEYTWDNAEKELLEVYKRLKLEER